MADVHKHMDTHNAEPAEGAAAPEAPQMTASRVLHRLWAQRVQAQAHHRCRGCK